MMQWPMINAVDTNNNRKEKRARDDRRVRIVDEVMVEQQQKMACLIFVSILILYKNSQIAVSYPSSPIDDGHSDNRFRIIFYC
jgi:hypothetical protein